MKKAAGFSALAAVVIAGWVAASPYLTMRSIGKAVQENDSATISEHVDFPALREDLKGKLMVKASQEIEKSQSSNPFAGLGQMLAMTMVNQMVEGFVTPAGVTMMLQKGKPSMPVQQTSQGQQGASNEPSEKPRFNVKYQGWSKVRVNREGTDGAFIFRRDGLTSWKLVAVDLH